MATSRIFPRERRELRDSRVLVTGASGFIGARLCQQLFAAGAEVIVLRRPGSNRPSPSAKTREITVALTDRAAVQAELSNVRPDLVFHLGGYVSGDRSPDAMKNAFDGNVLSSANLLFACAEFVPNARVVISTSLDASDPWTTRAETGSPYGVSKLQVEILAGGMRALHGTSVVSARVGMTYGPHDPNVHRLVPAVIEAFLAGEAPHLSSGRRRCDWIHVADVVDGLTALGAVKQLDRPSLDIGTGQLTSIRGVAESIRSILKPAKPIIYDSALDRPHDQERAAELSVTRRELGWSPQLTLEQGLYDTINGHLALRDLPAITASDARARSAARIGRRTRRSVP
jgi:UDP-glucose 4-epimerase